MVFSKLRWAFWIQSHFSCFLFFLLYFGCPEACRIPHQGWNPQLLEWKCSLNHWTAREVPSCFDQLWPCSKILPCSKLLPFLGPFTVVSFEDVPQGPRFPHTLRGCWTRQLYSNGSVQFGRSVVSASLRPHGPQHAKPPCPSPTPGVYSNSCPLSWWCHLTISSSLVPFSSHLQSFPESGSYPMSQFFVSGGQRIGVSASASVLPMNIQDWFPSGWPGWISLQSKGLSRVFSNTTVQKHQFFNVLSDIEMEARARSILREHPVPSLPAPSCLRLPPSPSCPLHLHPAAAWWSCSGSSHHPRRKRASCLTLPSPPPPVLRPLGPAPSSQTISLCPVCFAHNSSPSP